MMMSTLNTTMPVQQEPTTPKQQPSDHQRHQPHLTGLRGQRPQCQQCGASFESISSLLEHFKRNHDDTGGDVETKNPEHFGQSLHDAMRVAAAAAAAAAVIPPPPPPPPQPPPGTPQQLASSETSYKCDQCDKVFSVPARLARHYRVHTGEKPFSCNVCGKSFSVKENLSVHMRTHTHERPYACDVCGRAFEHSGKLHRHVRIHTGERPHRCDICGKTFIQSGQLVIHRRTHTGEKPYQCQVCTKAFTCSKQLKVHMRTHTGEKPYKCNICNKSFGYNHVLKLHQVSHFGEKVYKCNLCKGTFNSKKAMEIHIRTHNEDMADENIGDGNSGDGSSGDPSPPQPATKGDLQILNTLSSNSSSDSGIDTAGSDEMLDANNGANRKIRNDNVSAWKRNGLDEPGANVNEYIKRLPSWFQDRFANPELTRLEALKESAMALRRKDVQATPPMPRFGMAMNQNFANANSIHSDSFKQNPNAVDNWLHNNFQQQNKSRQQHSFSGPFSRWHSFRSHPQGSSSDFFDFEHFRQISDRLASRKHEGCSQLREDGWNSTNELESINAHLIAARRANLDSLYRNQAGISCVPISKLKEPMYHQQWSHQKSFSGQQGHVNMLNGPPYGQGHLSASWTNPPQKKSLVFLEQRNQPISQDNRRDSAAHLRSGFYPNRRLSYEDIEANTLLRQRSLERQLFIQQEYRRMEIAASSSVSTFSNSFDVNIKKEREDDDVIVLDSNEDQIKGGFPEGAKQEIVGDNERRDENQEEIEDQEISQSNLPLRKRKHTF